MGMPVRIKETGEMRELTILGPIEDNTIVENFVNGMIDFDEELGCYVASAEEFVWWQDALHKHISVYLGMVAA
jgi:hypothetical protein